MSITTPSLHKPPAVHLLTQKFISTTNNKTAVLLDILSAERNSIIMVFCNSMQSCRAVDHIINDHGIKTACYHSGIPPKKRTELWEEWKSGEKKILVCTDLAARGLDTHKVDHVILFDFPTNKIDYLHRVGRTARAGSKGKVTSLVGKKDESLADTIQNAIKKGEQFLQP